MLILMKPESNEEERKAVCSHIEKLGFKAHPIPGEHSCAIGITGNDGPLKESEFLSLSGVVKCLRVTSPYKLAGKKFNPKGTEVKVGSVTFGEGHFVSIAGPCSVETTDQMEKSAKAVKAAGVKLMRGGAFKPRTSPYSFQGVGFDGLDMFRKAADKEGLPIVTELLDIRHLDKFLEQKVDVIQIGTRSMQNFELLREVGKVNIPIILKRGMSATISEWLMAAEYIAAGGNHNIIFCERGIRTFETYYRNVLDVTAIPVLKKETHLPVIIDPSHSGGKAWMVAALSRAGIAAGADGLLVEMHPNPCEAWCDADQAINPDELKILMNELSAIAKILGRTISD